MPTAPGSLVPASTTQSRRTLSRAGGAREGVRDVPRNRRPAVITLLQTAGAGKYVDWGVLHISITNLAIIAVMVIVFVLALVLPFPHGKGPGDGER